MLSALTPDKGRDAATLIKNLVMMQNVCAALAEVRCAHLVYASSDAVYGSKAALISEETLASPDDLYGAMHLSRELMARSLGDSAVLTLRPTGIYGSDDTHNSYGPNRFRRTAIAEKRIRLFGRGEEMRDHVHVDDLANLTVLCLERRSIGVLNVATGVSCSFANVARLVVENCAEAIEIENMPRASPITHRHFDITALIKAFPEFRFTALDQGLARDQRQMKARWERHG
jgi:UDP-glucose 4-epimerase